MPMSRGVSHVALLTFLALVGFLLAWGVFNRAADSKASLVPAAAYISIDASLNTPTFQGPQICSWLGYFGESQILVGTADDLVQNTGAGWQVIFPWPGSDYADQVNVSPDGTIYVLFTYSEPYGELYRSTDDGQTWEWKGTLPGGAYQVFPSPVPDLVFTTGGSLYMSEYPVYRSTDGGISWTPGLGLGDGYTYTYSCSSVACSPAFAQDGTAFAVLRIYKGSIGVWKTTDWGESWFPVTDGLYQGPAHYGYVWVGVSPRYPQDQTAFTLDWHGIYQTTDGGAWWTQVFSTPPEMAFADGVLSPCYPQDRTLLTSGYGGLWLSQDDGRTWRNVNPKSVGTCGIRASGPLTPPPTPAPTPGPQRVYLPLVAWDAPLWRVYLPLVERAGLEFWVIAPAETEPPYTYYLYCSTDYGGTWEQVPVEY